MVEKPTPGRRLTSTDAPRPRGSALGQIWGKSFRVSPTAVANDAQGAPNNPEGRRAQRVGPRRGIRRWTYNKDCMADLQSNNQVRRSMDGQRCWRQDAD